MMTGVEQWQSPAWQAQARAWIADSIRRQGRSLSGSIEPVRLRPWSAVLRAPTTEGMLYFKAAHPVTAHELPVLRHLMRRGSLAPQVLSMESDRGWLLMADAGKSLREVLKETPDPGHWRRVLSSYAGIQEDLADASNELIAQGVPDRRLTSFAAQFEGLLEESVDLALNQAVGLTSEEYRQLRAWIPDIGALCEELAAFGIPETLDHGDLHDGNVFVGEDGFTLADWGDSAISHPFFSFRVVRVSLASTLGWKDDGLEVVDLLDSYLEEWSRYGTLSRLRTAYRLAQRLAFIHGALKWQWIFSQLEDPYPPGETLPVPALLRAFLEDDRDQI
jgi:aminoglycoside phosphotransferase (APT) family kinase protein